ncbi:YcjF family protein [Leptolyngbya sp. CCNP1308]|uniref:YcjF family protein n=1 Tax=Leptolyngbya sp. CCNP1308 TaxID=3110255 RepID=UPI002B1EFF64|nr:YcjF family protein [Leptolyngbya sp. CCNP1308]MEA5451435.1 YcjF family protein [Leptolyngbya sp. CCNP1308]
MGLGVTNQDDISTGSTSADSVNPGTSKGRFSPKIKPGWALPALLKRPLLVGGLGLSASLALLGSTHINPLDSSTLLSAIALGSGLWWWRRGVPTPAAPKPIAPPVVDRSRVENELATLSALIDTLAQEAELAGQVAQVSETLTTYRQGNQDLGTDLDRPTLRVAIAGEPRTGKTTLLTLLTAQTDSSSEENAPLNFEEVALTATPDWLDYDGLLLITDGDITDSALTLLRERAIAGQGAVLVFNKQDHYDAADQETILTQLQQRVATLPATVPVVTAAAAPRAIKVRRHQADGTFTETMETPEPALAGLQAALDRAFVAERSTLVAATVLRHSQALRQRVQTDINRLRRDRALPLIDQLQWVAGAAAFANPVPTLDLLATVAINGQLILDLGKIYGFNLTLNEAKTAAGTLASLTVKLGLVELSTQVLTAVLKSHFATYVAGGLVQGLSAAYLTRMAGLSLVDYFEQAALAGTPARDLSWEAIAQRLQTTIQQNRQLSLLQTLAKQGIDILKPAPAQLPASTAPPLDLDTVAVDAIAETIPATAIPLEPTPPPN